MISAITFEEMRRILRAQVSREWFDELVSDADGQVIVYGVIDEMVALDAKDAREASGLRVRNAASLAALPASGAEYATATIRIKRNRVGRTITIPAGTLIESVDAHRYRTLEPETWGGGELVEKQINAQAVSPGWPGILPPGSIDRFVKIANGVSGIGTAITLTTISGSIRSLKLTTDLLKPHLYRAAYAGLYWEITACAAHPSQRGRQFPIAVVNDGSSYAAASSPESRYAWTTSVDTSIDAEFSGITSGTYEHEWAIRDWDELGFTVRNSEEVTGGRSGFLDEHANARGRSRQPGEGDEQVRARLVRAPERPSPLGVLRKAIVALAAFGVRRSDIKVYEMGERGPDAVDLYAVNFPSSIGFIRGMHCRNMSTPHTPAGMYSVAPDYTPIADAIDPGLALRGGSPTPFRYVVRWDPPVGMAADVVASARLALWQSLISSGPSSAFFRIYEPTQWGYP